MEIVYEIKTANYIKISVGRDTDDYHKTTDEMRKWCVATKCGKQVTPWTFAFKTEAERMMFKLKWGI
jgi:hypothetical protein